MQAVSQRKSSADGVCWNLGDLYQGITDPRIESDLNEARERAKRFESTYRGKIDVPGGPPADRLLGALTEFEQLSEQLDRPAIYAGLAHAAKTDDPARGALLARTREGRTAIKKHPIFFDLEWVKVADESAE